MVDTKSTKFIFLLGDPVQQSFSDVMQNTCYQTLGLDYLYKPLKVTEDGLRRMLEMSSVLPVGGYAITKPYKVKAVQFMDGLDPIAEQMGAINTVVLQDGKRIGYNTDGYGALRSIREESGSVAGKVCFCFGAGGTGRAVCMELANAGIKKLYICSRSRLCEELSAQINQYHPDIAAAIRAAETEQVWDALQQSELVLNLTGLGMTGKEGKTPVDKSFLRPDQICFDATYNPGKPQFLLDAESLGCQIINGLGMVLYQGLRQVELWTGYDKPDAVDAMREPLMKIAAGK